MKKLNLLMVFVLLFSTFYAAAADKYYTAYGGSEASATTNVIRAWREAANSSNTPTSVQCQRVGLGSVWQCTARGYA
ncbi:hypothetical protein [Pseudoalteromonas luteoviolacea]|uniref:Uncharacterized protein n=1 Tax=Pseudoalteromonas luteoviolacea H33 TaxID=1365251 RepID=A0A162AEP2_9GAMM|nr:hypothetical protein [Pseudoalteromonas luteoviolacea]KZN48493.1 hypothetical protein N476_21715 [Pseudoalteromonas luteoviolacea H33]KZN73354.1 hypothetical protein N477_23815 [Pseudoalteromonas luteoviolacea H33-S]